MLPNGRLVVEDSPGTAKVLHEQVQGYFVGPVKKCFDKCRQHGGDAPDEYLNADDSRLSSPPKQREGDNDVFTVFDVGANTGLFALEALHQSGGKAQVYSFEPIPATFKVLEGNTSE
eukprot:9230831-Pyramimonas_sp.AAC.2